MDCSKSNTKSLFVVITMYIKKIQKGKKKGEKISEKHSDITYQGPRKRKTRVSKLEDRKK